MLEYILYHPFDPKVSKANKYSIPEHFAVCAISKDKRSLWIDLGPIEPIAKTILEQRKLMASDDIEALNEVSAQLYELLMKPVENELKDKKLLLIAPDSILNVVSFSSLKDSDHKYLIENYELGLLGSGRDLLFFDENSSLKKKEVYLIGAINFDRSTKTKKELKILKKIIPKAKLLYSYKASERVVKSIKNPYILHLATHGFFMPNQNFDIIHIPSKVGGDTFYMVPPVPENPLLRSGLVLAGANNPSKGANDGILTAFEVSSMDLSKTELVVLSACDTGLGDILPGEGVFGLRRAFSLAGAKAVVMTLWPASDIATPVLMGNYYKALKNGATRTGALKKAQISMLNGEYKHPRNWANFTHYGQWKPLVNKSK